MLTHGRSDQTIPLATLAWLVEAGADEAIGEDAGGPVCEEDSRPSP